MFAALLRRFDPDPAGPADRKLRTHHILFAMALGGLIVAVFGASLGSGWGPIAVGELVGLAVAAVSGLVGFLFGIPISGVRGARPVEPHEGEPNPPGGAVTLDAKRPMQYRPNTSLEDISDWLTKIIVGVGLTQIREIPVQIDGLVTFLAPAFGSGPTARPFALGLVGYFAVDGFLFGYLWTRLRLQSALSDADLDVVLTKTTDIAKGKDEADADALRKVDLQLTVLPTDPSIAQEDMSRAIREASERVKVEAFFKARPFRELHHDAAVKADQAGDTAGAQRERQTAVRALPIFRALVDADTVRAFHRNRSELAFCIMDGQPPDWAEAVHQLTDAIQIRDLAGDIAMAYKVYELRRAVCRIELDPATAGASGEPTRSVIVADLRAAAQADEAFVKEITETRLIASWLARNNIAPASLRAA